MSANPTTLSTVGGGTVPTGDPPQHELADLVRRSNVARALGVTTAAIGNVRGRVYERRDLIPFPPVVVKIDLTPFYSYRAVRDWADNTGRTCGERPETPSSTGTVTAAGIRVDGRELAPESLIQQSSLARLVGMTRSALNALIGRGGKYVGDTYIHGLIFVGPQNVGDLVEHPKQGWGVVTHRGNGKIHIRYDQSGKEHNYELGERRVRAEGEYFQVRPKGQSFASLHGDDKPKTPDYVAFPGPAVVIDGVEFWVREEIPKLFTE